MALLTLSLTKDCNLRCHYCYALGGESRESMDFSVAKAAIDFAGRYFKSFRIQFTGGEPLLNFPLLKRIVEYTYEMAVKYQLQTNATLIKPEIARWIKKNNIATGISLDGPLEINNITRPRKDGRGSTLDVIKGIKNLRAMGVKVAATCTLTQENIHYLSRLVDFVVYTGISGLAFDLLRPIGRGKNITPPDTGDLSRKIKAALSRGQEIAQLGGPNIQFREKGLFMSKKLRKYYCPALKGESLAVMPDGKVYPCPSFDTMDVFYLGNILSSSFAPFNSNVFKILKNRSVEAIKSCKDCNLKYFCGGGCPARSYSFHKDIYIPYKGECVLKKSVASVLSAKDFANF